MPIEAVLSLKPGDVLALNAPVEAADHPVRGRRPGDRARPGRSGGRRAVQITGPADRPR